MRIVTRSETPISPWVRIVETVVEPTPGAPIESYHAIAQADYVAIVARTPSSRIPIVQQFRPCVGALTWELPAGLVEEGEAPEQACRRELREEAGLEVLRVAALGAYHPCTARLANRSHVFFAETGEPDRGFAPEHGLTVAFVTPAELRARILDGSFAHQLHLGALAAAELHGHATGVFSRPP